MGGLGKRLAQGQSNLETASRLKELIGLKRPVVWSGDGLSYALAQAFSHMFLECGIHSYALTTSEFRHTKVDALLGYISRSGRPLGRDIDLIVTQAGNDISWTNAACFTIPDVDHGIDPWLALDYTEETLVSFGNAMGAIIPKECSEADFVHEGKTQVLVLERFAAPIDFFFRAVNDKLDSSGLIAVERDGLGHGFHFRLWKQPSRYALHFCLRRNDEPDWVALRGWARKAHVETHEIYLNEDLQGMNEVIETFRLAIQMARAWAKMDRQNLSEKPLPNDMDRLR